MRTPALQFYPRQRKQIIYRRTTTVRDDFNARPHKLGTKREREWMQRLFRCDRLDWLRFAHTRAGHVPLRKRIRA